MSNGKTESTSDKLRRWADESEDERPAHGYPSIVARTELGMVYGTPRDEERKLFRHIADEIDREKREVTERYARQSWMNPADAIAKLATGEIEWDELQQAIDRYYLPRPLFEDGEPVQFGDTFVRDYGKDGTVSSLTYTKGNSDYVNVNGYERHDFDHRLKRPKQQVLDAEGVPIEVGDTVWSVETGARYIVEKMGSNGRYECHDMLVRDANGTIFRSMGRLYTHREPDSLEKLRDDILEEVDYLESTPYKGTHDRFLMIADRLTTLIELDGRDA